MEIYKGVCNKLHEVNDNMVLDHEDRNLHIHRSVVPRGEIAKKIT